MATLFLAALARVAKAAQEAGADSLGLIAMDELGRRGFVAPPVMKKAEARNRLSHLQLERLQSEGRMAMIRSLLQIRALRVRNDLLELRQQIASTFDGALQQFGEECHVKGKAPEVVFRFFNLQVDIG